MLILLFYFLAEAVQLLVSSLADDSSVVREASMASLRDIASLYAPVISFTFKLLYMHNEFWDISDTEMLCDFPGIRFWFSIVAMLCHLEDEG